ncbi:hypothetical protein OK074_4999 [Actinobacteria bacterium OK074]|nr:hypothetical protein OK074_4999 [Actinobacteria bacterium OK074]
MIARLSRHANAGDALQDAYGSDTDDIGERRIPGEELVDYWYSIDGLLPRADRGPDTARDWCHMLDLPVRQHQLEHGVLENPSPLWHCSLRLHPEDRPLTAGERWEVNRRMLRAAGISPPGDDHASRWLALAPRPGRLEILASLVREDGKPARLHHQHFRAVMRECRRLEEDLGLRRMPRPPGTAQPAKRLTPWVHTVPVHPQR